MIGDYCMNSEEAAEYIGIGINKIRELAKRREIPFVKVGKNLRFYKPLLEAWIEERARNNEWI